MPKKYAIIGNADLGLMHPAIKEFYSDPDSMKLLEELSGYSPDPKKAHALMFGHATAYEEISCVPPYYLIIPVSKGQFSEIEGTDWDSIRQALAGCETRDERKLRQKWESLEGFDERFVKTGLISAIRVHGYHNKVPRKSRRYVHRVSRNS